MTIHRNLSPTSALHYVWFTYTFANYARRKYETPQVPKMFAV